LLSIGARCCKACGRLARRSGNMRHGPRSHRGMLHRGSRMECRRGRPRDCRCAHVWRRRGGSGHRSGRCRPRAGMSGLLCGSVDASGDQKGAANSGHNGKRKPKLLGKHGARLPLIHLPHIKNARARETIRWFAEEVVVPSDPMIEPSPASKERTRQMISAPSSSRGLRAGQPRFLPQTSTRRPPDAS
jgi:hypothetical protein